MGKGGVSRGRRSKRKAVVATLIATASIGTAAGLPAAAPGAGTDRSTAEPLVREAADYSLSPAVRDLSADRRLRNPGTEAPTRINPEPDRTGAGGTGAESDPSSTTRDGSRTPTLDAAFDGVGNPAACSGCVPPDTSGDVGPSHYVQMVNATKVAIFNKSGVLQTPIFNLGTLWPAISTCSGNDGDPIVLYDEAADRWLLSQFQVATNSLCFAISQTSDPLGAYHLFQFNTPEFPDYFKVGVWPSGYYVSANESTYTAYALDRTKMLAGDVTASYVRFSGQTNFLLPADVDGPLQPAGGGLFYTFKDSSFHGGVDRLELFELIPNFTTPAASTFTLIETISISPFTYTVCGFFILDCIPQSGTAEGLDAVSEWPMWRFAYRDFGTHETLVGNFTIKSHTANATSAGAGIRWFELRDTGPGWSLFQEGTLDPNDGVDRWMGSIAIDQAGNIGLGYSASSNAIFPGIRYATRAPGDPAGTLQAEQTLQAGGGAQTSAANRWGDYSAMSVDPVDDCRFWYTNEYYSATSANTWSTRIGNFSVPGCAGLPAFSPSSSALDFGSQNVATTSGTQTVTVTNTGTANLTISSVALTTGNAGDFQIASDTCSGATVASSSTCAVGVRFGPTAGGSRATILRFTDNAAGSPHDVSLSGTGTLAPPPAPDNDIDFGKLKRNKKKGTATLTVEVPGPGQIGLTGTGVKPQRPHARRLAARVKPVGAAGAVKLKIKPKGNKKRKLNKAGRVKVKVKVKFTPTGGAPNTESKSVKLKKTLR